MGTMYASDGFGIAFSVEGVCGSKKFEQYVTQFATKNKPGENGPGG
jgi:hypothetical protein